MMRQSWIRYGNIIFLDAMLKRRNHLSWPYIGPCGIDNEKRVCVFCESLVCNESFESYEFVMTSLFQLEPSRNKHSIQIIYGDCMFNEQLLPNMNLSSSLFYDHYHLLHRIWPEKLTDNLFRHVESDLSNLLNADSEDKHHHSFQFIENMVSWG